MALIIEYANFDEDEDWDETEEFHTVSVQFQFKADSDETEWKRARGNVSFDVPVDRSIDAIGMGKKLNECCLIVSGLLEEWAIEAQAKHRSERSLRPKPRPRKP